MHIISGYSTCSNVLFNKVLYGCVGDLETLHLICRVNNLDIGAFILHNGKEKAQCVSFPQLFCTTVIGNITNTTSGEIFFTHRTKERGVLNGTWTCRNGAGERDDHSSIDLPSNNCKYTFTLERFNELWMCTCFLKYLNVLENT